MCVCVTLSVFSILKNLSWGGVFVESLLFFFSEIKKGGGVLFEITRQLIKDSESH